MELWVSCTGNTGLCTPSTGSPQCWIDSSMNGTPSHSSGMTRSTSVFTGFARVTLVIVSGIARFPRLIKI